jgi:hypothetical protein
MLEFLIISSFIVTILIVWFQTDAFAEYCNLLKINWFLKEYNANTTANTFSQFLAENKKIIAKNNSFYFFFLKLVTCPYCLSMWLCILGSVILGNVFLAPCLYIVTLFCFFKLTRA